MSQLCNGTATTSEPVLVGLCLQIARKIVASDAHRVGKEEVSQRIARTSFAFGGTSMRVRLLRRRRMRFQATDVDVPSAWPIRCGPPWPGE